VICGGVATSRGDFWCTKMVDRCLSVEAEWVKVEGEKAATVGGFGSPLGPGEAFWEDRGGEDMWSIQGRSGYMLEEKGRDAVQAEGVCLAKCSHAIT
jgi:hypothetical protein